MEVPITVQSNQHPAFSDQHVRTRHIILGLTISLILNYLVVLILDFILSYSDLSTLAILALAVLFPAFYNIVECICFFGYRKFSYCAVLTLRIMLLLGDFGFFITNSKWSNLGETYTPCMVFHFVAMGLNITILIFFGRLPRYDSYYCRPNLNQSTRSQPSRRPTPSYNEAPDIKTV